MKYLKPKKLLKGDVIGIISPASAVDDEKLIQSGIKYLEGLGYRTKLGKNVGKVRGYLAGTDEERVEDIHQMFGDKSVKAIFCLRGGYGAFRLLDKINYKLLRNNPKIFVGFSEITALQMTFLHKANLITFAGPMVVSNFSNEISNYTEENFWRTITSGSKPNRIELSDDQIFLKSKSQLASGLLVGGNLAVFASLIGTGYLPEIKNKILLLEEVNEPPYKIDRMFNQLKMNKVFKKVNAVLLGNFLNCIESDVKKKTLTVEEVWRDYFKDLKIPVINSFPHGHIKDMLTVPFGINIKLNLRKSFIKIMESCVR
jgi:muramoyltetrapeptide carboxypeptidase